MASKRRSTGGRLVRWMAYLVPAVRRAEWRREWGAELYHARNHGSVAAGSFRHAVTLRLHDLDTLRQDLGYAVRGMVLRPGFSLAVILTLAFGIGANSGVFSLIHTVLLRPLPVPDSDRVFLLFEQDSTGATQLPSFPTFLDWYAQSSVFEGLAFVRGTATSMRRGDETAVALSAFVTPDFFSVFPIVPALGRLLGPADYVEAAAPAAVISHGTWVNSFGADSNAIGLTVQVDDIVATVVGVLPPEFVLPQWAPGFGTDVWMSLHTLPSADRSALMQRDFHADSRLVGLLQDGIDVTEARASMEVVARRLAETYPETQRPWTRVQFLSQRSRLIGDVGPRLVLLGAAVFLVLLICCVNLANLFLTRGAARAREFAIRSAIGAGRGRVFRQLLTESLLLVSIGAAAGTFVAAGAVIQLRARLPATIPRLNELSVDWTVFAFSLSLTVVTATVFALVSARQALRGDLGAALRQGVWSARGSPRSRVRGGLVAAQVALSLILLVAAGLLLKSLERASSVDPGFDPDHLTAVQISPRMPAYRTPLAAGELYRRIAESVQALPGVMATGLVNHAPFGGGGITSRISRLGDPRSQEDETRVFLRTVSERYFETMGIPVVSGREFNSDDLSASPGPLVINETLARIWGENTPIGQPLAVLKASRDRADFGEPIFGTVVGVVGDIRHFGPEVAPSPTVYVPFTHDVWSHIFVIARTRTDPSALLDDIEDAVRIVEPGIPLEGTGQGAYTMTGRLGSQLAPRRLNAVIVAIFAAFAMILALIGVYGVTTYAVSNESREIGIRLALGANPRTVERLFLNRAAKQVVWGLVVGLVVALWLGRFMTAVLFGVTGHDPITFVAVAGSLLVVGLLAGYVPARRAARVDPVRALRT